MSETIRAQQARRAPLLAADNTNFSDSASSHASDDESHFGLGGGAAVAAAGQRQGGEAVAGGGGGTSRAGGGNGVPRRRRSGGIPSLISRQGSRSSNLGMESGTTRFVEISRWERRD